MSFWTYTSTSYKIVLYCSSICQPSHLYISFSSSAAMTMSERCRKKWISNENVHLLNFIHQICYMKYANGGRYEWKSSWNCIVIYYYIIFCCNYMFLDQTIWILFRNPFFFCLSVCLFLCMYILCQKILFSLKFLKCDTRQISLPFVLNKNNIAIVIKAMYCSIIWIIHWNSTKLFLKICNNKNYVLVTINNSHNCNNISPVWWDVTCSLYLFHLHLSFIPLVSIKHCSSVFTVYRQRKEKKKKCCSTSTRMPRHTCRWMHTLYEYTM